MKLTKLFLYLKPALETLKKSSSVICRTAQEPIGSPTQIESLQTSNCPQLPRPRCWTTHADNSITLSNNTQFNESLPILSPDGLIDPIICSDDKIWAEKVDHVQIGTSLRQENFVGDLEELFRRFGDEWRKRWDRHLQMPVDYWDPVVAHFTQNTPRGDPMPHNKIGIETWYNTLKKKKNQSAAGPDGWSRQDRLHMPKCQRQALLDLLYAIESVVRSGHHPYWSD